MSERNIVILRGYLGSIETRVAGQHTVARVGINVKEFHKRDGELDSISQWFNIELWNEHIQAAQQLKAQRVQVEIHARLVNESWLDKTTGSKRSALKLKGTDICAYSRQTALDADAAQSGLDTPPEDAPVASKPSRRKTAR